MKNAIFVISVILTLASCSGKRNDFSTAVLAENACQCFEKLESGSVDERLAPCLTKPINDNQHVIHERFYPDLSLEAALSKHMMETMAYMVHHCEKYYTELNAMFDNMYPAVEYLTVEPEIDSLQVFINSTSQSDSIKLKLIHQKITLLTKARRLDEALKEIQFLTSNYSESETYFIKIYIYRLQGKYDLALKEIDKAVKNGNEGYSFYAEMIKRKKNDR